MAKVKQYKLKALSVQIGGKVFHKEDGVIFSSDKFPGQISEIESAAKAGFLFEVKDAKAEAAAKAEAEVEQEVETEAKKGKK